MERLIEKAINVCEKGIVITKQVELKLASINILSNREAYPKLSISDRVDIEILSKSARISFIYARKAALANEEEVDIMEVIDLIKNGSDLVALIRRSLDAVGIKPISSTDGMEGYINDLIELLTEIDEEEPECDCQMCSMEDMFCQGIKAIPIGGFKAIPIKINKDDITQGNMGVISDLIKQIINKAGGGESERSKKE